MFATVSIVHAAFADLPAPEFKLLVSYCRRANVNGECSPALRQIAVENHTSEATSSRITARLIERGCMTRERRAGGGRYVYRLAERFRPTWPSRLTDLQDGPAPRLADVQDRLSQHARQKVSLLKQEEGSRDAYAKSLGYASEDERVEAIAAATRRREQRERERLQTPQPEPEPPPEEDDVKLPTDTVLDDPATREALGFNNDTIEALKAIYLSFPYVKEMRSDGQSDTEIIDAAHALRERGFFKILYDKERDRVGYQITDAGYQAFGQTPPVAPPHPTLRVSPQQAKAIANRRRRRKLFRH